MSDKAYIQFDAATVPLAGANIIEASAGTGKTYSIAIMTLRLLLEKGIPIEEILMVTFTKAAVAELVERVRKFVRKANEIANGNSAPGDEIESIVMRSIDEIGKDKTLERLRAAMLFIDEASIFTIHGFSQKMLGDFAFETGQLFGADIIADSTLYIQEEVNKFWRKNITALPLPLLKLWPDLKREKLVDVIKGHQAGKHYFAFDKTVNYCLDKDKIDAAIKTLEQFEAEEKVAKDVCLDFINENKSMLQSVAASNKVVAKWFPENWDDDEVIFAGCWEKKDLPTFMKKFPEFSEVLNNLAATEKQKEVALLEVYHYIICNAITVVLAGVERTKQLNNVMSYDDIIERLHHVLVVEPNERLIGLMQKKYKAIFIDEFQDTDKLQYEIFNAAFVNASICFFIGDPKQSIYGFRKADIYTYFKAKNAVDNWYSMNYNFRSTAPLIASMNSFFLPEPDFDTFHFGAEKESISYVPVQAPASEELPPTLLYDGKEGTPMSVVTIGVVAERNEAVCQQVMDLLVNKKFKLQTKMGLRPVQPSDIGIVVRSNKTANPLKAALAKRGISAIVINDTKVTDSAEVDELAAIIKATLDSTTGNLHTAMEGRLVGLSADELMLLDDVKLTELFIEYKDIWENEGFYSAMMKFASDFNLLGIAASNKEKERSVGNFTQLVEILHKQQLQNNLSPEQILQWLNRAKTDDYVEGDEYTQRIESDEEAIKIVTVHKSKGLQYNIVIAPELDLSFSSNKTYTYSYRRVTEDGEANYVTVPGTHAEELFPEIERQENQAYRRLLYVAVTRAVCKCIFITTNKIKNVLPHFLDAMPASELLVYEESPEYPAEQKYTGSEKPLDTIYKTINNFEVEDRYWSASSYSGLSADMAHSTKKFATAGKKEKYDVFIFETLSKGKQTGNFLHTVFEQIDFAADMHWQEQINRAAKQWMPSLQEEEYAGDLLQFIESVVNAKIKTRGEGFFLKDIPQKHRLNELQFDFPLASIRISELEKLLRSYDILAYFKDLPQIQGMMTGSVDMFFKHDEKYYILDWKSTYLGDTIEDYSAEKLADAMTEKNYHLQYVIYTVACHLYLKQRLADYDYDRDFGGVIYAYVRGMRAEREEGIYFTRLEKGLVTDLEKLMVGEEVVN